MLDVLMANDEPFSLRKVAVPAFAPTMLFGIGEGAILPVVPLTARQLGGSVAEAALIVTLIGLGSLVSNVPASLITLHRGERWALVAAAAWCTLAMTLCAWTDRLAVYALGSFMIGMSQSVFSLARQSYLTEVVPPAFRARALSTLGGVMRIGLFVGPFAAAAAIHVAGLVGAYVVGIAALVLSTVVSARVPDLAASRPLAAAAGSSEPGSAAPTLVSTIRDHRRIFLTLGIGVMLVSSVRATRQAVIPLWADHLGLAPSVASLVYGLAGGIELLVFYPAGKVMDQKGRRWVAVPSLLLMAVGLLGMPFTHGALALLLAALVVGFGNGIGSGLMMTLGADHSPKVGRPHFLGIWRLFADLGSCGGPALLSFLAATLSLAAGVGFTGIVAVAAAAQLAYWIPKARGLRIGP